MFTGLVAVAGCLALRELYRLCFQVVRQPLMVGIGLAGCVALIVSPHVPGIAQPGLLVSLVAILSIPLLIRTPLDQSVKDAALT